MKRLLAVAAAALGLGAGLALLAPASPAAAHPLGNFSVNQLESLALYPDRVEAAAIVDTAELPTLQDKSTVDTSGDGVVSDDERAAHAARACADLAGRFALSVRGDRLTWTVGTSSYSYASGAAGLSTSRLDCALRASADLAHAAEVRVDNHYLVDRVGWREITAAGHGVRLVDPPVPATSRSGGDLRSYPADMLSNPPDVRSVALRTEPGEGGAAAAASTVDSDASWTTRLVSAGERKLNALVGERGQGPLVGLLAVLLALTLGAAHAALPGHGKTIMAAYLAGKQGRARDAVAVGGVVTLTHTGGVLVVGLLLTTFAGLVGQAVLGWLGVVSGVLVVVVGAAMLIGLRRRGAAAGHGHHHGWLGHGHTHDHGHTHSHDGDHAHDAGHTHDHDAEHTHDHEHGAEHTHDHGAEHTHDHGAEHTHDHEHGAEHTHDHGHGEKDAHVYAAQRRPSRLGIAGIGVAGGLVPSPSALIVLLGAVGLGRTFFGVLLVLAYGLGMAGTLTAAGLALVGLQRRWARRNRLRESLRWQALFARFSGVMPTATGSLVLLVGLGLVGRSAAALF